MPLASLASLRPQRQPTRFTSVIWVNFFCQALGAPIPLLRTHAVARPQCACQKFVLNQYGDHVLTCKKHTGAIAGHDHVMNVSAQLATADREFEPIIRSPPKKEKNNPPIWQENDLVSGGHGQACSLGGL